MNDLQRELDRLEAEDPTVRAASADLDAVYEHIKGRLPSSLVADIYNPPPERLATADMCEDITARLLTSQRDDPPLYPQLMQKTLFELKDQADESLDPALFHWARWLLEQLHHRAVSGIPFNEPQEPAWSLDSDEPQEDPHV